MLLPCREPAGLFFHTRLLFQVLPTSSTLSAADLPTFPNAKIFDLPAKCHSTKDAFPAAQMNRLSVQRNRAARWESDEAGEESCGCREEQAKKTQASMRQARGCV